MTRQLRRYNERVAAKSATRILGEPATADQAASRYIKKLTRLPLTRLQRELKAVYGEARQMNRVLEAFHLKEGGEMPLISSDEAPLALAIGNKYFYIAGELARRGVQVSNDTTLGGPYFAKFFGEVAEVTQRGDKETATAGFLSKFTTKVKSLLKR